MQDYLTTVNGWLEENPNEVLTFLFTNPDGASLSGMWEPAFQASGITDLVYTPPQVPMAIGDVRSSASHTGIPMLTSAQSGQPWATSSTTARASSCSSTQAQTPTAACRSSCPNLRWSESRLQASASDIGADPVFWTDLGDPVRFDRSNFPVQREPHCWAAVHRRSYVTEQSLPRHQRP